MARALGVDLEVFLLMSRVLPIEDLEVLPIEDLVVFLEVVQEGLITAFL